LTPTVWPKRKKASAKLTFVQMGQRQSDCLANQQLKMRNAEYAPTDTPKSIRLINCLKPNQLYRSSGARHASIRFASAQPLMIWSNEYLLSLSDVAGPRH